MVTAWQPAQHAEKCSASEYFKQLIHTNHCFSVSFVVVWGVFFYVLEMMVSYVLMKHSQFTSVISSTDYMQFCFQFQKQGKDLEKVKQRLVEIANYVDKVKHPAPLCTGGINHLFKIEIFLAAEINGTSVWYINFLLKQLTLVCLTPLPELCLYSLHAA